MANITIRNIPDSIFDKIKLLSEIERRSLNNEMLIVIEKGTRALEMEIPETKHKVSHETRMAIWKEIAGKWKDSRSTKRIIKDIYDTRSMGREVDL